MGEWKGASEQVADRMFCCKILGWEPSSKHVIAMQRQAAAETSRQQARLWPSHRCSGRSCAGFACDLTIDSGVLGRAAKQDLQTAHPVSLLELLLVHGTCVSQRRCAVSEDIEQQSGSSAQVVHH